MARSFFQPIYYPGMYKSGRFRVALIFAFALLVTVFVVVINTQRRVLDPNLIQSKLVAEGKLLHLDDWEISLFDCPESRVTDRCKGGPTVLMPLPGFSNAIAKFQREASGRAVAVVSHFFTERERSWLDTQGDVVLVIPRNVQENTENADRGGVVSIGVGSTTSIPFLASELKSNGYVNLKIDFSGLSRLGPIDVPIALVNPDEVETYSSLPSRQIAANHLLAQLGIGLPLILAAMALVLDHSLAFGFLSLYGLSRALRSFVPFLVENGVFDFDWFEPLYSLFNGFSFGIFLLLMGEIVHFPRRSYKMIAAWLSFSAVVFLGVGYWLPNSWMTLDLYTDLAKSSVGIPLSILAMFFVWKRWRTAEPSVQDFSHDVRMSLASLLLIVLALSLQAWVNLEDLRFSRAGLKSILDWRHLAVFPALTVAALLEVGLTSRRVQAVAKEIADKQILDREIEMAQDFQKKSLPSRKFKGDLWSWKAVCRPASRLGGDWFDVRELRFADGRVFLLAAIVDVTGHGVGAALSTTIVAASWGLWCREVVLQAAPSGDGERRAFLEAIPKRLHAALDASGWNGSGTGAFALICPVSQTITYCTAGHPPIVVGSGADFSSLTTVNAALGHGTVNGEERRWNSASREIIPGETLILYSDGILPAGASSGSFLSGVRRQLRRGEESFPLIFMRQLVAARRGFRENRQQEDDVTLLVVTTGATQRDV